MFQFFVISTNRKVYFQFSKQLGESAIMFTESILQKN